MKTTMKLNLKWICRVCLEQSENMLSIFTKDNGQILANKVADCGGIEIELNNHKYPDKICPKCMAFLNISHQFRTTCKNTDALLRSLLDRDGSSPSLSPSSSNTTNNQTTRKSISKNPITNLVRIQHVNLNSGGEKIVYEIETENDEENDRTISKIDEIELEIEDENLIKIEDHIETDQEDDGGEGKKYEMYEDCINHYYVDEDSETEKEERIIEEQIAINEAQNSEKEKRMSSKREKRNVKTERTTELLIKNLNDDYDDSDYNPLNDDKNDYVDEDDNDDDDSQLRIVSKKRRKRGMYSSKRTSKKIESIVKSKTEPLNCEFICEICGNKYKKKVLLDSHMRWHNEDKAYKCEVCGRAFTINFQLTRHMRVHTGDKPYSCNMCDRKFSDYSTCKKHQRTHTDERPFKCEICGKAFNYSHVLKVHMAVHTGEKPYACNQCDKKFSQPHHLKAHLATLSHQGNNTVGKSSSNALEQEQEQEQFTYVEQLEDFSIQDNCEVIAVALEEDVS